MSPRRIRFCQIYADGYSATDAAIQAGYSAGSAAANAHRLLKDHEVSSQVTTAIYAKAAREKELTEKIIDELTFLIEEGMASESERLRATGQMLQVLKIITRRRPKTIHPSATLDFSDTSFQENPTPVPELPPGEVQQTSETTASSPALPMIPAQARPAPTKPSFSQSLRKSLNQRNLAVQQQKKAQNTIKNHHSEKEKQHE